MFSHVAKMPAVSALFFYSLGGFPFFLVSFYIQEVIKSDNPSGGYIITFTEGFLKPQDDGPIVMDVEDKIRQVIQGGDFGASSHGEVKHIYDDGFAANLDDTGLQNVLNSDDVTIVEEDGYVELDQVKSWGLDRIDDEKLPLDKSYNPAFGNNGAGVTTYVIDTGILDSHQEFEGRATQEYNSVGDGKNYDCNGHGTHVAGTIGSKNYGVANKAKLVGVKVLGCTGSGTYSGVIAGVNWVKANAKKPATANMSLGGGKSTSLNAAINALVASGVTTVVAAGNSNRDACLYSPASEPNAITVASTTSVDSRSGFSNWGTCVDIFAPGSSITAPWIGSNTAIRTISGTSMASPHVCGAVALYLGHDNGLSVSAVTSKLLGDSIKNKISNAGSGTPNRMLFVGRSQKKYDGTYFIRSAHGTHIRIYNYNKVDMTVNQASWEKITIVPLGNEQYALKSAAHGNRYLRVPGRGSYRTINTQTYVGGWEKFYITRLSNGKVVFKSVQWGNYLRANKGNNVRLDTQTYIGGWEQFTLVPKE